MKMICILCTLGALVMCTAPVFAQAANKQEKSEFNPHWFMQVQAGASYTLRTGWNWLEYVIFRVAANGAGRIYWNEANTFSQPFYALLEASIRFEHRHWAGDAWGRNQTDTRNDSFYFMSIGNSFLQRRRKSNFGETLSITL